ncbi:hypothetical protein [Flavobacterium sp.]|uniref:hypothetical protein n=1 Tax=Flavobacterium sp. TaxID=239 RepID=UPI003F6A0602
MIYEIIPESYKKYNLVQSNQVLGSLNYSSWFNIAKVALEINTLGIFEITRKSSWKSDFYVSKNNKKILEFTFSWNNLLKVTSCLNEEQVVFKLVRKGFWGNKFLLLDENNNEICIILPQSKWKNFKTIYKIEEINTDFYLEKEVLYLSLIHCIVQINAMTAAVI